MTLKEVTESASFRTMVCLDCGHAIAIVVDPFVELPTFKCPKCIVGRLVEGDMPEGMDLVQTTTLAGLQKFDPKQVRIEESLKPGIVEYLLSTRPVASIDSRITEQGIVIDRLWLEDGTVVTLSGATVTKVKYERKE